MLKPCVLVVGASGGIGNTVAQEIIKSGFDVIGTYHQHPERLENLTGEEHFSSHQLDLRDLQSVQALHNFINQKTSSLYGVVNCAGIVAFEGENLEQDVEIWHNTIATNLTGNFYLAQVLAETLSQDGRFIMISSTDASFGGAITASYAASKAGVNSLTKSLSLLLQPKRIRVNAVAPGWVVTPMIEVNGDEFLDKVATINPLQRNALPIDVANLILFLLGEKSNYLNGQVIALEGGYTNQDPTLLLEEEVQKDK